MKSLRIILLSTFYIFVFTIMAQGVPLYESEPVDIDTKNITARTQPRVASTDKNGEQNFCGLLLLKSTINNLTFPDAVGDVKYEAGTYYVYLKPKTKKVTVESGKNKLKLKVDGGIEQKTTYSATVLQKDVYGTLSIKAKPVNVNVSLNGKTIGTTPIDKHPLYPGEYRLRFTSPGYVEEEEVVKIEPEKNKSLSVELLAAPDYKALYRKFRGNSDY